MRYILQQVHQRNLTAVTLLAADYHLQQFFFFLHVIKLLLLPPTLLTYNGKPVASFHVSLKLLVLTLIQNSVMLESDKKKTKTKKKKNKQKKASSVRNPIQLEPAIFYHHDIWTITSPPNPYVQLITTLLMSFIQSQSCMMM